MNQRDKEPWMTDNRPMYVGGGVQGGVCGMAPAQIVASDSCHLRDAAWGRPVTIVVSDAQDMESWLHDLGAYACGLTEGDSQGTDADMAPSKDPVQSSVDTVIDHLIKGETTDKQRTNIRRAVNQADRVAPVDNEALGRAIGR